jgi:PII-like signaling protein
MRRSQGAGQRLRIYLSANDQWHGKPLYAAIVQEARKHGMAGATVARGIMGYGAHGAIHEPQVVHFTNELPVVIEIVDTAERIQGFVPYLDNMVQEGLVTLADIEVIAYGNK